MSASKSIIALVSIHIAPLEIDDAERVLVRFRKELSKMGVKFVKIFDFGLEDLPYEVNGCAKGWGYYLRCNIPDSTYFYFRSRLLQDENVLVINVVEV